MPSQIAAAFTLALLSLGACGAPTLQGAGRPRGGDSGPPPGPDTGADTGPAPDTGADTGAPPPLPALVINELMADNNGAALDPSGRAADWVELYNAGPTPIDLGGIGVSDSRDLPFAWVFPAGDTLAPGAFRVLWAPGDIDPEPDELPFALSRQGEGVGLFAPDGRVIDWVDFPALNADESWARVPDGAATWEAVDDGTPGASNRRLSRTTIRLIDVGSTWAYQDTDTDAAPPGDWSTQSYDDADWPRGAAPLGYGDPVATTLSFGDDPADKNPAAWFRHTFSVDATTAADAVALTLALRVDDGAIVYLNGVEAHRFNLPSGPIPAETYALGALSGDEETTLRSSALDPSLLQPGENTLAVQVHQAAPDSSDLLLDLALTAERVVESE